MSIDLEAIRKRHEHRTDNLDSTIWFSSEDQDIAELIYEVERLRRALVTAEDEGYARGRMDAAEDV